MRYLLVVLLAVSLFGADTQIASDDFSGYAAPCRLNTCGAANWETVDGGNSFAVRYIANNYADSDIGLQAYVALERWKGAGSFTNDQYAAARIQNVASGVDSAWIGVAVRTTVASASGIWAVVGMGGQLRVGCQAGLSAHGSFADAWPVAAVSFVNNDILDLHIEGTTLTVSKNGTPVYTRSGANFTGSCSLATGTPGLAAYGAGVVEMNNWVAGNVTGGAATVRKRTQVTQ